MRGWLNDAFDNGKGTLLVTVPYSILKNELDHLDETKAKLREWIKVFGHLSENPDTASNLIYEEQQKRAEEYHTLK
jgi:hypothetical protein